MNGYVRLAAGSGAVGLLLLLAGLTTESPLFWFQAHAAVMVVGVVLPAVAGWHTHTLATFTTAPDAGMVRKQLAAFTLATLLIGLGMLFQPSGVFTVVLLLGFAVLLAGSVFSLLIHLRNKPTGSLVDVEANPLTKGDDASFKHLKFAHFFLPLGVLLLALAFTPGLNAVGHRLWLSGIHVTLVGYGLLSLYGIGHLWVPRFSNVPAIAAGAIKGELHSTLPAMVFLPIGFLTGWVGFIIAGGAFAFLGFFTYMGVLGANIMRNKSVTHRVTPEFVYIPWTFAGIFWLVSGVLMGVILPAVPDVLLDKAASLRTVHVHANLLGGFAQLLLAWLVPKAAGVRFQGSMKAAFYGFNLAVALVVGNMLASGGLTLHLVAIGTLVVSMLLFVKATGGFMKGSLSRNG